MKIRRCTTRLPLTWLYSEWAVTIGLPCGTYLVKLSCRDWPTLWMLLQGMATGYHTLKENAERVFHNQVTLGRQLRDLASQRGYPGAWGIFGPHI